MTHAPDEPLDGDIGPAAGTVPARPPEPPATDDTTDDAAEELRRAEADREARRRRTNANAGQVTAVLLAMLLLFLAIDSVLTAVRAHRRGDAWLYPPAVNAAIFTVLLVGALAWYVRLRRR